MKKLNKILTILTLVIVMLSMSLIMGKVEAAITIANNAENRTVTVRRNVNDAANNVTNTFGYTIVPDNTYNAANVPGYENGVTVTNSPASLSIAFSNVAPTDGTATATNNIDFAGTTFTKPGNYRFKITETSSTNPTTYPVSNEEDYVYVEVRYDTNDNLVATVLTQGTVGSGTTKEAVIFDGSVSPTYISISKRVTGNMGDREKYFDVNVTVAGTTGTTYTVEGGSYASNPSTVTAGTQTTLKIKHGETITIGYVTSTTTSQVPIGAQYTVTEPAVTNYTTTVDSGNTNTKTSNAVENPANNATAIVNNYEVAALTGIFYNIIPYAIIAAVVLILIAIIRKSSKRKE